MFQKVALIGMGLLGGSLGLVLKQRRIAQRVEGFVRRDASVGECEKLKVVDRASRDLESVVAGADLVVLCTPLSQMRELTERMLPALASGTIVTDVGSVKGPVVEQLEPLLASRQAAFIGSHPMAGGEKIGVRAARADLFDNAICLVTPTVHSGRKQLQRTIDFWKAMGCRVLSISPRLHDDLVSRSSHLPHVVAAELSNYVLSPVHPKEQAQVCATGFRDTTRIASGSPEMWRDIALANRENLVRVVRVFIEDLQEFCLALDKQDAKAIEEFFEQAKHRRDAWRDGNAAPE